MDQPFTFGFHFAGENLEITTSIRNHGTEIDKNEQWESNFFEFLRLALLSLEKTLQISVNPEFSIISFFQNPQILKLNIYSEITLDFFCSILSAILEKNQEKLKKIFLEDLKQNTSQMLFYKLMNLNERNPSSQLDMDQGKNKKKLLIKRQMN